MLNQMCRAGAIRMQIWFIIVFGEDRHTSTGSATAGDSVRFGCSAGVWSMTDYLLAGLTVKTVFTKFCRQFVLLKMMG